MSVPHSFNLQMQKTLKGHNFSAQGNTLGLGLDKNINPEGVAFRRDIGVSENEFNPCGVV